MKNMFYSSCLCSILFVFSVNVYALTGDDVISSVDKHEDGYVDLSANIEMILLDPSGNKNVRKLKFYSIESKKIGEKRTFVFSLPKDVKGTAILIHSMVIEEDKQWIYLPAFKRVKRISSANRKSAFIGSQFSYEDLASQEKEKYKNEFLYEKVIDGKLCYVVKRTPVFPSSGYKFLYSYVEKKNARYVRNEYFNEKEQHVKTLNVAGYDLYKNRFLLASSFTMKNHLTNKTTIMKWSEIKLERGLSSSKFRKSALERIR